MHVLTPTVFDLLDELVEGDVREGGQIQLTTALNALARREKLPGPGDPRRAAQPRRQVRRRRGPDRPRPGGRRPRADARHLAGNDRAHRAEQALRRRSSCRSPTGHGAFARAIEGDVGVPGRKSYGHLLIETIRSDDPAVRDRSVHELIAGASVAEVLRRLRDARGVPPGLGEPLRAGPRLDVPARDLPLSPCRRRPGSARRGRSRSTGSRTSCSGGSSRRSRRSARRRDARGPTARSPAPWPSPTSRSPYQTLADQVRRSVRNCPGNRWMFRVGQADEHPIRLHSAAAEARVADEGSSRSWSSARRSGSTCRTAPGPTSSSSAWTIPRGRGS